MIRINGQESALREGDQLRDALALLGLSEQARGVAVAVDGEVVPRANWQSCTLHDEARIEVLSAMQGG